MKRILSILFGCYAFFAAPLTAQHAMGLVVGDFNSPYSYSLNPALSRTNPSNRAYINWWGASVSLENNFMKYNAPFRLGAWVNETYPAQYADINGSLAFQQGWLPVELVDNFKMNYLSEVNGPSFFIPIDEIGTFGFGVKEVSGFSVNGVNGDFGGILRYGLPELEKNAGKTINQNEFSINTEKYQEWFMNFAGIAQSDGVNVWKWGTTAKLLIGMGMAHLGSDNLNFTVANDAKSIDINQFNGRLYRSSFGSMNTLSRPLGMSFDFIEGAGMGIDLGVVYEKRPNGAKKVISTNFCDRESFQQYNWKFGASLTDIGFISYWGDGSRIVSAANSTWVVDPKIMQNTQNSGDDRLSDLDNRLFADLGAEDIYDIFSTTPMALNIQFDKYLGGNIHMGAYWTQNLKRANSIGLRRASYLNITPRYQTEQFEYGFPITIANDYTALHMGMYGRLGPVIIGTDNIAGLGQYINNGPFSGGSFYFGVRSKIGGCDKRTKRYSYIQKETFYDTLIQRDTQQIKIVKVERDTIIETKKETTTIKDETKNESAIALEAEKKKWQLQLDEKDKEIITLKGEAQKAQKECTDRLAIWKQDAEKCKKAQSDIEAQIKKKEAEIALKEKAWSDERARLIRLASEKNPGLPKVDTIKIDCAPEINKAKAEIELAKADRNKAIVELEEAKKAGIALEKKCDEEKKRLQDYLDKLQAEIALLKKAKSDIEAENKILKDQVDRLSGEALKQPCDVKIAECETKLGNEIRKNAQITVELEKEKAKSRNAQIAAEAAENKAKAAAIQAADANNEAQKWKSAHDQIQLAKKICDETNKSKDAEIAALKAQMAVIKAENENLKKSANTDMSKAPVEDCTPYKSKAATLEAELAAVKSQLAAAIKAQEDCTPYKTKAAALEAELAAVKSQLAAAIKAQEDCTPYKTKAAGLESELAAVKAQLSASQARVTALESEVADLKKKIGAAIGTQEDCTPYKTKLAGLEAEIAKLKASQEDCGPYKTKITALEAEIAKLKAVQITLQGEKSKVEIALEEAKKSSVDVKTYTDEIAKLKAQIAALEKEKASAGDCSECDKALANSKAALAAAEAKVSDLEAKLAAGDKSAELTAEINRLKEEIKKKDNQINGCKLISDKCTKKLADVEALLAASEKAKALCNTEYEDLKKQIIAMDEDMGKLGEIIKTNNAEISKLNAEMGTLRTQLKECETKLSAATAPKEETPN